MQPTFVNGTCPGKSWKKGFLSPGKPWNLVFASPGKSILISVQTLIQARAFIHVAPSSTRTHSTVSLAGSVDRGTCRSSLGDHHS